VKAMAVHSTPSSAMDTAVAGAQSAGHTIAVNGA
jgi:hypothetical protein